MSLHHWLMFVAAFLIVVLVLMAGSWPARGCKTGWSGAGSPDAGALLGFRGRSTLPADHRETAMKRLAALILLSFSLVSPALGQSGPGPTVKSGVYISSGSNQFGLAVTTNTQLTVPANTTCAYLTVEGASVRRTSDGTTNATTTVGTLIAPQGWTDCGPLASYKFTAVSGSPTIDAEYNK